MDSGQLTLSGGGTSSNGTFNIAAGAVLDLTGGANPTWQGQISGSGAGSVVLNSGTISASNLRLNLPGNLFQWAGGSFNGSVTNLGVVNISGASASRITGPNGGASVFNNQGLVQHIGTGSLLLGSYGSADYFTNLPGGVYQFASDATVGGSGDAYSSCYFQNRGLVWKSAGTNASTLSLPFNNQDGSIQVDSGTLRLANASFSQGSGTLTIQLGGRGAGQSGQLSVSGSASLGGPLTVTLAGGFVPVVGDQFQIVSSGSRSGAFSTLDVPAGIAVLYTNSGVVLSVTGAVSGTVSAPLRIASLEYPLGRADRPVTKDALPTCVLICEGPADAQFVVEHSPDLVHWRDAAGTIVQTTPGWFRATVTGIGPGAGFLRLRLVQLAPARPSAATDGTQPSVTPQPRPAAPTLGTERSPISRSRSR